MEVNPWHVLARMSTAEEQCPLPCFALHLEGRFAL